MLDAKIDRVAEATLLDEGLGIRMPRELPMRISSSLMRTS